MGNNICQCKIIYQNLKETDLSSVKSKKNLYSFQSKKSLKNNNKNVDLIKINEKIKIIYINNCAKKIAKAFLQYKNNKNNKIKNQKIKNIDNVNSYIINNKEEIKKKDLENGVNDNSFSFSIKHPFFVDKVHRSRTKYEKIDIPKINNGMSLEILLNNNLSDFEENPKRNVKK